VKKLVRERGQGKDILSVVERYSFHHFRKAQSEKEVDRGVHRVKEGGKPN